MAQGSDKPTASKRARPAPDETGGWAEEAKRPIALIEALAIARKATAELTGLPIDGIVASDADGQGGWHVTVDAIEGAARMGENDLLAAYSVQIGGDGALLGYRRLRRYRREEESGG
ncbi:MAG: gas vesicle protein GvpO [Pseudomonadota bacterium]